MHLPTGSDLVTVSRFTCECSEIGNSFANGGMQTGVYVATLRELVVVLAKAIIVNIPTSA